MVCGRIEFARRWRGVSALEVRGESLKACQGNGRGAGEMEREGGVGGEGVGEGWRVTARGGWRGPPAL